MAPAIDLLAMLALQGLALLAMASEGTSASPPAVQPAAGNGALELLFAQRDADRAETLNAARALLAKVAAGKRADDATEEGMNVTLALAQKDPDAGTTKALMLMTAGGAAANVLHKQKQARAAWCGLSAANAVQYMARAGTQIALSVVECAKNSASSLHALNATKGSMIFAPCTADIAEAVASLLWVAAWVSLAVTQCAERSNVDALCAGIIEALVASLTDSAASGAVLLQSCRVPPRAPVREAPFPIRRLQEAGLAGNPAYTMRNAAYDAKITFTQEEADLEMAMCVQDAALAATSLGQYGVAIDQTVFACPLQGLGVHTQELCIGDVSFMLNRLFQTMALVGAAISHCGRALGVRLGTECFAAAMQVTASVAGIPLIATGEDLSCPGTLHYLRDTFGPLTEPIVKVSTLGRRLEDTAKSAVTELAAPDEETAAHTLMELAAPADKTAASALTELAASDEGTASAMTERAAPYEDTAADTVTESAASRPVMV